ncbi:tRNA-dihydrouridine(47) synthase [NAD(P)(+)]-like [Phalaenopsis equestris]|uniref:tRNA-dihydrouridine(47) synthase [NAD(P)(+)]-like n=1 Tax=Phalaenopsis equestris TaxID=78828 RepID=UPI0009E206E2|nr:tRNA-dihydrouridine(47) synthase [NAD(P)(+)]-like [Phalaenopsis equestris]
MDGPVVIFPRPNPDKGGYPLENPYQPSPKLAAELRTPEEQAAKAIAPVKAEYLRPPPSRTAFMAKIEEDAGNDVAEKKTAPSGVVKEKKSKRQLKRERKQEQKSAVHICSEVAKSGRTEDCRFGGSCRFNHDINAFLAQKPADLEGVCPFATFEGLCPYGITCRFLNTHQKQTLENRDISKKNSEVNILKKDLQKLLWKNKFSFTKADSQLKALGLKGNKSIVSKAGNGQLDTNQENSIVLNDLCADEVDDTRSMNANEMSQSPGKAIETKCSSDSSDFYESRRPKKVKSHVDGNIEATYGEVGKCERENDLPNNSLPYCCEGASSIKMCSKSDLSIKPLAREKKLVDFRGKLYLAPLTTVGNLPFRRICKNFGAEITCGEMAVCTNLLQGQASEWALLRRHSSEDFFGVQICGAYPDSIARTIELIDEQCEVDFIDINMGCPIDLIVNKGAGSSLLTKPMRMKSIIQVASGTAKGPVTIKVRTGFFEGRNRIDSLISDIYDWGTTAITVHGRSRQQRYSKLADWNYIYQCTNNAPTGLQVLGNGDIFSYCDYNKHMADCPELSTCMIARGALIKPWIFTEIKEQRHWDISSGERLNIFRDFVNFGLEHWGSDTKGVETTRHFLLEWLSYTHRYIPVGLLDIIPQRLNWRPPSYSGRDDLETLMPLMASDSAADWIRISEMLLGKVPEGFTFAPKHKSNAYDKAENG